MYLQKILCHRDVGWGIRHFHGSSNSEMFRSLSNILSMILFLALKATDGSFQINSAYRLSRFGDYPALGTTFTYDRHSGPDCPDECIRADGPIDVSIDVKVCACFFVF
jgi:hypothetical protein